MAKQKTSSKLEPDEQKKRLIESVNVLTKWLTKWQSVFQNTEVTELQVATYSEALSDISPDRLETACAAMLNRVSRFPVPADIREATQGIVETIYLGPPMIDYALLETAETRKDREEYQKQLHEFARTTVYDEPIGPPPPPKPQPIIIQRSLEEQLAELRKKGWIA